MNAEYSMEEVRAIARRLHDDITVRDGDTLAASDMLTAYAERIKADESAVTAEVVQKAVQAFATSLLQQREEGGSGHHKDMRAALLAVWPSVPAQPADSGRVGDATLRAMVEKLAAHVRPTCGALWDEAQAALAAQGQGEAQPYGYVYQAPDEDPVFEYAADRWSEGLRHDHHVETPVYAVPPVAAHGQPAVEITDSAGKFIYVTGAILPAGTKLYTHPASPAGVPSVPAESAQPTDSGRLAAALRGLLEIGKRDLTNPKYDGFWNEAHAALAAQGRGEVR